MQQKTMQQTNKKFPKFKRARGERPGLKMQPRDIQIIKLVYDHRFLDSDQIRALTNGSGQVVSRRLQKLFHNGYLDRPSQQFSYTAGGKTIIYGLGNKGSDILSSEFGIDRGKINWMTKNHEAKMRHLNHTMMISNFRVCLALGLKETQKATLIFWKQNETGELRDHVVIKGENKTEHTRLPINPDSFFAIQDLNGKKSHFFLEADQSTMTNARFFRKMRAYWNYWKQGGHTLKYDIKSFRVITLTKSIQRADNLRRAAKLADDKQKGTLMFWFTSEREYTLEEPGSVLRSIWQTPADDSRHSILE